MKKNVFVLQLCFAFALTSGPVAWAAGQSTEFDITNQQMQALAIRVMPLQQQTAPVMLSLPAQVVVPPNREQIVSSPLAGLAVQLFVQQNQVVKQGAPLLRLVSPELGPLQLQAMQASTRATLARQTAKRERALFNEGIIPERRVQEAQAALQESEAALRQAKAALRLSGLPAAAINRITASGKLEDSLTLRAAQAGTVTSIDVKPGQRVEASTALLHLAQTDILWLDIQAPVTAAVNWQPGARLKIRGRDSVARIVSIGSSVSPGSQSIALRAVIETGANGLRAGEFVTVELPSAATSEGWDVPLSALAHEGKQAYVFVRSPKGFIARPVKVITSAGQRVRIVGPLKAGENIAVSGVVALKGAWLDAKGGN